jgi:hypothetical protein
MKDAPATMSPARTRVKIVPSQPPPIAVTAAAIAASVALPFVSSTGGGEVIVNVVIDRFWHHLAASKLETFSSKLEAYKTNIAKRICNSLRRSRG